jgi:cell fate (sporulation/competence/biofilm development) regulator YlbF (YheA/YmcA/DUF963 family)
VNCDKVADQTGTPLYMLVDAYEPVFIIGGAAGAVNAGGGITTQSTVRMTTTLNGLGPVSPLTAADSSALGPEVWGIRGGAALTPVQQHKIRIEKAKYELLTSARFVGFSPHRFDPLNGGNQLFTVRVGGTHHAVNNSERTIHAFRRVVFSLPPIDLDEASLRESPATNAVRKQEAAAGCDYNQFGRRVPILEEYDESHVTDWIKMLATFADLYSVPGAQPPADINNWFITAAYFMRELREIFAVPHVLLRMSETARIYANDRDLNLKLLDTYKKAMEEVQFLMRPAAHTMAAQELLQKYRPLSRSIDLEDNMRAFLQSITSRNLYQRIYNLTEMIDASFKRRIVGTALTTARPGEPVRVASRVL